MTGEIEKQPAAAKGRAAAWRENLELTASVIWVLVLTVAAIVGGSLVHNWAAPKDALCNTNGGVLAQQESNGVLAHCGIDSFLSQVSDVVRGLGIAAAALEILFVLWIVGMTVWGLARESH